MKNEVFENEEAVKAWRAYRGNKTGFPIAKRAYAAKLPAPSKLYARAPATLNSGPLGADGVRSDEAVGAFAAAAASVVLLGPERARRERSMDFVHTRSHLQGAGHASALIEAAQAEATGPLFTCYPACRGWEGSLTALSNFFSADSTILDNALDIARPGETPGPLTSQMSFFWHPTMDKAQHVRDVRAIAAKFGARRGERSKEYGRALEGVVRTLEAKLQAPGASAVEGWPSGAPAKRVRSGAARG